MSTRQRRHWLRWKRLSVTKPHPTTVRKAYSLICNSNIEVKVMAHPYALDAEALCSSQNRRSRGKHGGVYDGLKCDGGRMVVGSFVATKITPQNPETQRQG